MHRSILVELYVGGKSSLSVRNALGKAGLHVKSVGISHIYVEVDAESDAEAIAAVRRVGDWSSDDVNLVRSYLDAPASTPGRRAVAMGSSSSVASPDVT